MNSLHAWRSLKWSTRSNRGLTMIELLIVIAILAVLMIAFLFISTKQLSRARDSERKSDLEHIKIAFEEYYNDNGCYPGATALESCNGTALAPYLSKIPCDPSTNAPYVYLPAEGNACRGYRVLTSLANTEDPSISQVGCQGSCGCGWGVEYNYGVSAGIPLNNDACEPIIPQPSGGQASPTPSPSSSPLPSGEFFVNVCRGKLGGNPPQCNVAEIHDVEIAGCMSWVEGAACQSECLLSNPNLAQILCDF